MAKYKLKYAVMGSGDVLIQSEPPAKGKAKGEQ